MIFPNRKPCLTPEEIVGAYSSLQEEAQLEVQLMHAAFHLRDGHRYPDDSIGTIKISCQQLRDLLAFVITKERSK